MTPVHLLLAQKLLELNAEGLNRSTYTERLSGATYKQSKNASTFMFPQEIIIVDQGIYTCLSAAGIKLLIQIQQDMVANNPLWHCETKGKTSIRVALAELKRHDILWPISGVSNMYIINPKKLRKGKPLAGLAALYQYCQQKWLEDKRWKLTAEDVRRLNIPDRVVLVDSLALGREKEEGNPGEDYPAASL